jgi:hypothetical protein
MKKHEHETAMYSIRIGDDRLLELVVKKDVLLDEKDVWQSRDWAMQHSDGGKFCVAIGLSNGSRVTADARRAVASDAYAKNVKALAIYSEGVYESVRADLFRLVHRPVVPTKTFTSRHEALNWLKTQAKS